MGEDRLMRASDYVHFDWCFPHTVDLVTERERQSERVKAKVMAEDALQCYTNINLDDLKAQPVCRTGRVSLAR
jgi:hypothetical protein